MRMRRMGEGEVAVAERMRERQLSMRMIGRLGQTIGTPSIYIKMGMEENGKALQRCTCHVFGSRMQSRNRSRSREVVEGEVNRTRSRSVGDDALWTRQLEELSPGDPLTG